MSAASRHQKDATDYRGIRRWTTLAITTRLANTLRGWNPHNMLTDRRDRSHQRKHPQIYSTDVCSCNHSENQNAQKLIENQITWNHDVSLSYKEHRDENCVETEFYDLVGSCSYSGSCYCFCCLNSSSNLLQFEPPTTNPQAHTRIHSYCSFPVNINYTWNYPHWPLIHLILLP